MATDVSLVITVPKFLLIASVSGLAFLIASYFLNLEESVPIIQKIKKTLFKNTK